MIAKGNLHGEGGKLAAYLTTGKEAELVELRGFATDDDIHTAFLDIEVQAYGTRCKKPFFHVYTRLPAGEELTREQWLQVADREEKRLGFTGQPRAIAFHHLADGTTHMHIAWSRIDTERGCAIDPGLYKNKLKEVCRSLENEMGLTKVRNERAPEDTTRSAGRNEFEQARRLETDLKAIRAKIRDCWEHSDNGKSFAAALGANGLILARGDRRDFVVIDPAGGDHALSKRITEATAAETRSRLADIDRAQLPSVAAAKAQQLDRQAERDSRDAQQSANDPVHDTRSAWGPTATRTTEPHAPNFDRDAADRAWAESVAEAGIAKDQAARQGGEGEPQTPHGENREADGASARFDAAVEIKDGIEAAETEIDAAPMAIARAGREGLGFLAKMTQAFLGLVGGWAMAPPKLTPEQARQEARAEAEAAPLREAARNDAEERARLNDILDQIKRSDEREQQQARERDDHERGRERER